MKQFKRLLSFCLSVIMLLSVGVCCIVPVSAESTTATAETPDDGDTTWFTDPATVVDGKYVISTADDLLAFRKLTRTQTEGKTFVLVNDIDVSVKNWAGVSEFAGNFDGQGHKIIFRSNRSTTSTGNDKNNAFFRNVYTTANASSIYIKNLVLAGTVDYIRPSSTNGSQFAVAGLIGNCTSAVATECTVDIENVYVDVDVTAEHNLANYTSKHRVAGVVGYHSAVNNTLTMTNVVYEGTVKTKTTASVGFNAACFIGLINKDGAKTTYNSCLNLGSAPESTVWAKGVTVSEVTSLEDTASYKRYKCINGRNNTITLDESYLIANPTYLETWTTCRLSAGSEEHTILPTGIAQMMGYAHSRAWIQKSTEKADNGWKLRILNTVETIDWESLSFEVTIKVGNGEPQEVTGIVAQTTVYNSIEAAGDTVTAQEMGGKFIYAIVLDGIPSNTEFTVNVTPIRTIGGVDYRCATQSLTLSFTE